MEELKAIMLDPKYNTENLSPDEVDEMFRQIDMNADGALSIDEIGKFITGRS